MSITTARLLTAEEFWHLAESEMRRELVRGEVVEAMPVGGEHGFIVANFFLALMLWAKGGGLGLVSTEVGFILDRNPDVVRAPDLFFVRADRLPNGRAPKRYFDFAPDLAVEVLSPSESAETVQEKVSDYLAAGTSLVVLLYPRTRLLVACSPDGTSRSYREDETFDAPAVLPGFSCRVGELFA